MPHNNLPEADAIDSRLAYQGLTYWEVAAELVTHLLLNCSQLLYRLFVENQATQNYCVNGFKIH
jgi:hypothetical protein